LGSSAAGFDRYRAAWEHSTDALLWADALTATIIAANSRAEVLTGWSADALVGMHITELTPAEQGQLAMGAFNSQAVREGKAVELFLRRADGTTIPVEVRGSECPQPGGRLLLLGAIRDITVQRRAERESASHLRARSAIHRAALAAVAADDELELMSGICNGLSSDSETAVILFANNDEGCSMSLASVAGPAAAIFEELDISWADVPTGRGPAGRAVRTARTQIINDVQLSAELAPWRPRIAKFGIEAIIAIPLRDDARVFGVLEIASQVSGSFGPSEQQLFEDVARQLVLGMRVRRDQIGQRLEAKKSLKQEEQMRLTLEQTVAAIAATIEHRDPYTAGHERAVAELAEKIGLELGLSNERCRGLFLAGLVHDVGKIACPAEILSKPGRLTPLEYELLKTHAEVGYEILQGIEFPWPIAEMTRQHHERLDGSGYPRQLRGEEILIEAQIIACADVIDAMSSHRPYRAALGQERAVAQLRAERDIKLNAGVVDASLRALSQVR
jgi:PAS domain S-box-containing protein